MAAPARSEIPNRSSDLTAAKTFVTTGSPVSTQLAQLLSWHQARGHGDTGRRSVTTGVTVGKIPRSTTSDLWRRGRIKQETEKRWDCLLI
ncbi:hypothetical protein AVEN_166819-1 [Araneus ventricosus]|uniref:Uncharacterized protein n=1 Tax=Araneus ventricosus TaxID=182803 RepID=A0A4Y2BNK8_ARAVE|nr:hypothetical protein AVEN_166819-1 [Araneus ventricosus]